MNNLAAPCNIGEDHLFFELIKSRKVFQGRAFNVRIDTVRTPEGRIIDLDIVDRRESVAVVSIDDSGHVLFVRQYRHPTETSILELPAGVIEAGETPDACAAREIREEVGMAAREIRKIGSFYLAPGYSSEFMHVFLAVDLYPDRLQGDEDELIEVEKLPAGAVLEMAETGQIQDAKSLAALLLARQHLIQL